MRFSAEWLIVACDLRTARHCKLLTIRALVEAGKVRTTHAARAAANELGFEFADMLAVVVALTPADFYKTMTTHVDHTVWQDVYRPTTRAGASI